MVEKKISIYGEADVQTPLNSDILVFEVGNTYAVLLVKSVGKNTVNAFEYFEFNKAIADWYEIFYQLRMHSKILDRSYNDTRVFYNLPNTVVMPFAQYKPESAEVYLNAIHGNIEKSIVRTDEVFSTIELSIIYSIGKSLYDMVNSNLMMISSKHSYSKIIEEVLRSNKSAGGIFMKVQFYNQLMVIVVMNSGKLQFIQSYSYQIVDDVLYHILNVVQQFQLPIENMMVEVAGLVNSNSSELNYLQKIFSKISFDTNITDHSFKDISKEYPLHYFSPFINLLL